MDDMGGFSMSHMDYINSVENPSSSRPKSVPPSINQSTKPTKQSKTTLTIIVENSPECMEILRYILDVIAEIKNMNVYLKIKKISESDKTPEFVKKMAVKGIDSLPVLVSNGKNFVGVHEIKKLLDKNIMAFKAQSRVKGILPPVNEQTTETDLDTYYKKSIPADPDDWKNLDQEDDGRAPDFSQRVNDDIKRRQSQRDSRFGPDPAGGRSSRSRRNPNPPIEDSLDTRRPQYEEPQDNIGDDLADGDKDRKARILARARQRLTDQEENLKDYMRENPS